MPVVFAVVDGFGNGAEIALIIHHLACYGSVDPAKSLIRELVSDEKLFGA